MKGVHLIILTALISGISIFLNAFGVSVFNPSVFTTVKNSMVAVFLITLLFALKDFKEIKKLKRIDWFKLISIGLVGGSIPFLLFFNGLAQIGSASGSFVHKLMFIFVGLFAFMFLKEKVSIKTWISGLALLLGNTLLLNFTGFEFNSGFFLVFGATILWAIELTISKQALKNIKPRIIMIGRMGFGALFLNLYLITTGQFVNPITFSTSQIAWVLFTSVLLLGYVYTFYTGLKTVKVTIASMILLLGSAITTTLQLIFLDKVITASQGIGIILLFGGVIFALYSEKLILFAQHKLNA